MRVPGGGWEPIDSAPKTPPLAAPYALHPDYGPFVELLAGDHQIKARYCPGIEDWDGQDEYWTPPGWYDEDNAALDVEPTHWRRLRD